MANTIDLMAIAINTTLFPNKINNFQIRKLD